MQEDRSFDHAFDSTAATPKKASIVRLDSATNALERMVEMNRTALPTGLTDSDPTDVGNWESSDILIAFEFRMRMNRRLQNLNLML